MNVNIEYPVRKRIKFGQPEIKHFHFKSGENQVQLLWGMGEKVEIFYRYAGDSSLLALAMLVDALRRQTATEIDLIIPYFPGARQDRVCNVGESFSLRVYAQFINSLNFRRVQVFDPHSDVVAALVDRCVVESNHEYVSDAIARSPSLYTLVSPDAGSNKKIYSLAKFLGGPNVIRADKLRDTRDGKIIETIVYVDDLTDQTCIIVDDIISGGRTFMELAKKLKAKGASRVELIVSHHEGIAVERDLKESGIDSVCTTDSLALACLDPNSKYTNVFNIEEYFPQEMR